ncbi:MAG: gliding motility-associated ABC transporter substrate-binding protein GldG [Bacteroidetes bacterium]|nr:gliding motility-associated ABC transporter substrate-binding protein GldG [Bacteroidota bacterium]
MYSLFKKEITSFFGSLTGYIAIIVFLTVTGVFMWIVPGESNILDNGYATLDALFILAPWVFLFLIPAVTMRSFAEEKRTGTLEIILTLPLSGFRIILAKFLSCMTIILFSLIPTLVCFFSVYLLGSPQGNIDTGGIAGSYIGLIFLASFFVSIGIFASAWCENQVTAFITSALVIFISFTGFDTIAALGMGGGAESFFRQLSGNYHYIAMSRGVIDTRDLLYFISSTALFFLLTLFLLGPRKMTGTRYLVSAVSAIIMAMIINFIFSFIFIRFDLTSEKRYTLSGATKNLLVAIKDKIYFRVYLEGDLPSGFRNLRNSTREMLDEFRAHSNGMVEYEFIDPAAIEDPQQRNAFFRELAGVGIEPTSLQIKEGDKFIQKVIFPGALAASGAIEIPLQLLQNKFAAHPAMALNSSIELLEYELAAAIKKVITKNPARIAFISGHGEYNDLQTEDIFNTLTKSYAVSKIMIDGKLKALDGVRVIVLAGPDSTFTEKDKFIIDQFIMNGGRAIWMIDGTLASMDSLLTGSVTVGVPNVLNLEDQLFRYGVRVNQNLVQDIQASSVPVNAGMVGGQPQWDLRPWIFFPLLQQAGNHPVVNNLDLVKGDFVSSIDTVSAHGIKKTPLLMTSKYSRVLNCPVPINLQLVNRIPEESLFNKSFIPVAWLLEGSFVSVFRNRLMPEISGSDLIEFKEKGFFSQMIVVGDADIIRNQVKQSTQTALPLGYDKWTDRQYGNKNFLMNCIDYLCDDSGLLQVRNRELTLRLLDRSLTGKQRRLWQTVNVVIPPMIIVIFGFLFTFSRRKKYAG